MAFKLNLCVVATSALILSVGTHTNAAVVTPISATSVTTIGGTRTINAAINSTGLSAGGASGDILTETHDGGGINTHYLSDAYPTGGGVTQADEVLTFDLGSAFDIDTIYIWTYNRPERARGVRTFNIAFSTDGGANFGPAASAASLGMADFAIGSSSASERSSVQTRTITAQAGVTDIRLTNIQNFGQNRIALPEIRFGETAIIPEPASAAMALIGLGALAMRRRRG